jgi:CheY-like chemotaxis protein
MREDVVILIVDDDEGHYYLTRFNLERAGLPNPIVHFPDGQAALDFLARDSAKSTRPSERYLMLLDIRMPKVDGIEVLARIKSHERLKRIPIIMLSTSDNPADIDRCYEIGCSGYVQKPIESSKFSEAVQCVGCYLQTIRAPRLSANLPVSPQ